MIGEQISNQNNLQEEIHIYKEKKLFYRVFTLHNQKELMEREFQ
jgi:hypothetical protein